MKKNIIYSFVLMVMVVLFTACGSDSKVDPVKVGPYSFFNATTPITVTKSGGTSCSGGVSSSGGLCLTAGTSCSGASCGDNNDTDTTSQISNSEGMHLSVQLLNHGLVAPGELVQMSPFDITYGAIVNQYVTTDENGRAMFEYEAPTGSNYDAIRGQNVTIQAVYLDAESTSTTPKVLVTQDFVLQFR